MKALHLGAGFTLPIDAITSKIAILAQSGAGKTTSAADIVEELAKLGQSFVVLDPKGDWHGIRSSADGKGPGLPVTVFGGLHGDLPIYPESGATVANLVVKEGISAVVDVSDFETDAARHRFTTDFAKAFYKAKQRSKSPTLFVLEEADESAPQQLVEATEAQMVGAIKRIVKLGRFCGIGTLMVSQRAADVNKKVLSQMQILVVMRTWHETDLKAIRAALKDQVPKDIFDEVMAALPSLETGEAYVVAPHLKIKQRVKFRPRETFDAGETPKVGQARREPKVLAPVQLDALREQMQAEVERAKAEDPKALVARIRDLEKKLQAASKQVETRVVEKPMPFIPPEVVKTIESTRSLAKQVLASLEGIPALIAPTVPVIARTDGLPAIIGRHDRAALRDVERAFADISASGVFRPASVLPNKNPPDVPLRKERISSLQFRAELQPRFSNAELSRVQQRILDELADLASVGIHEPDRVQLALFCGYTNARSGGFSEPVGDLAKQGYVEAGAGIVRLTDKGRKAAKPVSEPPTTQELQERLIGKLDGVRGRILQHLIGLYPAEIARPELAEALGYTNPRSGGFSEPLGSLCSLGLVDSPRPGAVRASKVLFLEA